MKKLFTLLTTVVIILSGCVEANRTSENPSCAEDKESMLYVMNLTRKVKPEHVSGFKESFEKCKVSTLQEPGCLDYAMYQSYNDSTVFFIAETWKNKEAHREHGQTEHLKLHIQEIKDMGDPSYKATTVDIYVCPNVNP